MNILAVDTTEAACSVALLQNDVLHEEFKLAPKQHNQILFPMLDTLLAKANVTIQDCDAIAFTRGPGSFTGIRIACAFAYGVATAADIPLIAISSLQALAYQAQRLTHANTVLAALDARMEETYWAVYSANAEGEMILNGLEQLGNCSIQADIEIDCAIGSAWQKHPAPIEPVYHANIHAQDVARAAKYDFLNGKLLTPSEAQPVYLRNQIVG